jgi:hypothetical protein
MAPRMNQGTFAIKYQNPLDDHSYKAAQPDAGDRGNHSDCCAKEQVILQLKNLLKQMHWSKWILDCKPRENAVLGGFQVWNQKKLNVHLQNCPVYPQKNWSGEVILCEIWIGVGSNKTAVLGFKKLHRACSETTLYNPVYIRTSASVSVNLSHAST